jgi:hypothetical protein
VVELLDIARFRDLLVADVTAVDDALLLEALGMLPGSAIGFHRGQDGWTASLSAADVDLVIAALSEYRRRELDAPLRGSGR